MAVASFVCAAAGMACVGYIQGKLKEITEEWERTAVRWAIRAAPYLLAVGIAGFLGVAAGIVIVVITALLTVGPEGELPYWCTFIPVGTWLVGVTQGLRLGRWASGADEVVGTLKRLEAMDLGRIEDEDA